MAGRGVPPSRLVWALLLSALLSTGAVAAEPEPQPAGEVSVFSDQLAFAIDAPGPELASRGYFGGGSLSGLYPTDDPGHVVVVTPPGDALVGRNLDLSLASLPILTWTWRRLPPDMGWSETLTEDAPMRLIVGFKGGAEATAGPAKKSALPAYDRALVVTWANDPWESGAADRRGAVGRFIAHGGPADGQWWVEAVNLADVHARLWPDIGVATVHIAWVAVAVRKGDGRSLGEIAGVALAP